MKQAIAERDRHWKSQLDQVEKARRVAMQRLSKLAAQLNGMCQLCAIDDVPLATAAPPDVKMSTTSFHVVSESAPVNRRHKPSADGSHNAPTMKILHSLAWWSAIGVDEPTVHQVAAIAGYAVSGSFNTYLGRAATNGLIRRGRGCVVLIDRAQAPNVEAPTTLEELHDRILATLDGPGKKIIEALTAQCGRSISTVEIAAATGYAVSGSFNTYLGRLASRGLIERRNGQVSPTSVLFPEALR